MQSQRLLENVRVIDLSQYIPGPFATRQLADLGAEVIKIEPPGGDPMRFFMHGNADELSPIYRHINRGKRICQLDLKTDAGRTTMRRLLAEADILLESFRPGVLTRLGFDRDTLERINPRLIHCALSGYGQNGPYAQRAGHDINYCALSSQGIVSGSAQAPVIGYPPIADHAAAMQAGIAMLAALHASSRGPGGIYLDISLTESMLSWQYLPLLGDTAQRAASILSGGAACYNIYQCVDEHFISLGAIEPVFWKNFCAALGRPQWIPRHLESMPQTSLIGEVAAEVATQTRQHWQALLDPIDCCFEVLLAPGELSGHAQFAARQALNENGPNYPAWINRQPLRVASGPEQVESAADLRWKSARPV
ncbi:MAG: CoA transferase [Gammaproteobacteria bacterium]|nr:CoA transferase [Gammaproteobacteria bacterium]MDH3534493.1 CoA transferase [Gammaproteobacteria bacterium]